MAYVKIFVSIMTLLSFFNQISQLHWRSNEKDPVLLGIQHASRRYCVLQATLILLNKTVAEILGHLLLHERKEGFAAGFGLTHFEIFSRFLEAFLFFHVWWLYYFNVAKMQYLKEAAQGVAYAYRNPDLTCFYDLTYKLKRGSKQESNYFQHITFLGC